MEVITDQQYLPTLLELLRSAKRKINILSFSFAIGSAAGKINFKSAPYEIAKTIKDIKKKHGSKIKIRFFTEGLRETVDRNKVTADFLEEAGVEVMYGSTHAKGFCFDDETVLFGSTNLSHQSLTKNREANLIIKDKKIAKEFNRYFDHLWKGGKHGTIKLKAPLLADGAFKDKLIGMIDGAKKRIEFSIYFFNHREIENALIRAHERGVVVTGFIHQHQSFAYPYIRANRATAKRMAASGINGLHFGIPTTFSHSKYCVVDRNEIMLGTGNWLVEDVLIHPQLFIQLSDPVVAKALVKHLKSQIAELQTS